MVSFFSLLMLFKFLWPILLIWLIMLKLLCLPLSQYCCCSSIYPLSWHLWTIISSTVVLIKCCNVFAKTPDWSKKARWTDSSTLYWSVSTIELGNCSFQALTSSSDMLVQNSCPSERAKSVLMKNPRLADGAGIVFAQTKSTNITAWEICLVLVQVLKLLRCGRVSQFDPSTDNIDK